MARVLNDAQGNSKPSPPPAAPRYRWQWGQKCVERAPITIRSIGVRHRGQEWERVV